MTRVKVTVPMSVLLQDRIRAIAAKKNMPLNDVVLKLIQAGLDTTQDLELYPVRLRSES
jgi:hypothetical protein